MTILQNQDKPTIVVSRCLGFDKCRYNADVIPDSFVEKLKEHVNYITVCPEVDIGLGAPRNPVRLVLDNEILDLYQPATKKIYTKKMDDYSKEFLKSLNQAHGFILKGRSPSCGIKDVKIYLGKEKAVGSKKGVGLFASYAIKAYPYLPIEEEGRLTNYAIREHFLTKVYTVFRFQKVKETNSIKALVKFQADNKYLFMAYNQSQSKILGQIVANHEKKPFEEIVGAYENQLGIVLDELPTRNNYTNAFMHIFGYFSDELTTGEKKFMLDRFQKFREEKIHISVVLNLLRTYTIKYNQQYLLDQSIWEAYPEKLLDISDTGK